MKVVTREAILRMSTEDYKNAASEAEREPNRIEAIRAYARIASTQFPDSPSGAEHGILFVNRCSKAQLDALNKVIHARQAFRDAVNKYPDAEKYVETLAATHGEAYLEAYGSVARKAMNLVDAIHYDTDRWADGLQYTDDPDDYPDWSTAFGPDIANAAICVNDEGQYQVDETSEEIDSEMEIPF